MSLASIKENGGVLDLVSRVKLSFTGNDRIRYLNGQVTAKLTGASGVQPACITTAKGKLCADVFISTLTDAIIVDADSAVAETLPPRLEKYIVADDVTVADVTHDAALIHCAGVTVEQLKAVSDLRGLPSARLGIPGCDLFIPNRDDLPAIWQKLTAQFPAISDELAELLRIEAGIPRWGYELDENTLPAEAGLDRTHVDFHKGCYIGQEVISRIKSVGHVNRSLRRFASPNGEPIPVGSRIFTADAPEKDLGIITSAALSIALGYLRRGAPEHGLFVGLPEAPIAIDLQPSECSTSGGFQ